MSGAARLTAPWPPRRQSACAAPLRPRGRCLTRTRCRSLCAKGSPCAYCSREDFVRRENFESTPLPRPASTQRQLMFLLARPRPRPASCCCWLLFFFFAAPEHKYFCGTTRDVQCPLRLELETNRAHKRPMPTPPRPLPLLRKTTRHTLRHTRRRCPPRRRRVDATQEPAAAKSTATKSKEKSRREENSPLPTDNCRRRGEVRRRQSQRGKKSKEERPSKERHTPRRRTHTRAKEKRRESIKFPSASEGQRPDTTYTTRLDVPRTRRGQSDRVDGERPPREHVESIPPGTNMDTRFLSSTNMVFFISFFEVPEHEIQASRFSVSGRKCPSSLACAKHAAYASSCMFSRLERDVGGVCFDFNGEIGISTSGLLLCRRPPKQWVRSAVFRPANVEYARDIVVRSL